MKNKYKAFVNSYVNFEFLNREGAAVLKLIMNILTCFVFG